VSDLGRLMDATWPAAARHRVGPWQVRQGAGGGKRVSCVTAETAWVPADVALAEEACAQLAQPPLFLVHPDDGPLDAMLAARGYRLVDPVRVYAIDTATLAWPVARLTASALWPPLAIMADIWASGGVGPARMAVMDRVRGERTAILGRCRDRAAGCAFVAIDGDAAMLHALYIQPLARRQGTAVNMMRAAANWSQDHGAERLFLAVTAANAPACTLYASLGMQIVGQYHYRLLEASSSS